MFTEYSSGDNHPFLEQRYFERMAASLGDKRKIISFFQANSGLKVLDIGAGGGEFANAISLLGHEVYAIDASDEAVLRMREKYPDITTKQILANHVDEMGPNSFDVVVCSSILHEVFSYGDDVRSKGDYSSLGAALESFYNVLKPGGRLIIRDGVLPENWADFGTITLKEGHDPSSVLIYLKMCPFANGFAGTTGQLVWLDQIGEKTFKGNVRSLLEFAYTYTWGLDSYPRETQELYAVKTLGEYSTLLQEKGFNVMYAEEYLQPEYPKFLKEKMELKVNEMVDEWFNSNAIWVAEKV